MKQNKRAKPIALHSAFDHEFYLDLMDTYAFSEDVLAILNYELAFSDEDLEGNEDIVIKKNY